MYKNRIGMCAVLWAVCCLVGCRAVYSPDVPQGNPLRDSQLAALQVGMPRTEVHRLLGAPLLPQQPGTDWYVYQLRQRGFLREHRQMWVHYDAADSVKSWCVSDGPAFAGCP